MSTPTLKLCKTLWGVDGADDPARWSALFQRIKTEGFDAVEAIRPVYMMQGFCAALQTAGLSLICQIHTTGGDIDETTGEYIYLTSNKLHDHLASFVKLTSECAGLPLKPVLINSHSGHDSWGSGDKAVAFFKQALKMEAALGVPIVHETHRQRLLYSPYTAAELLALPELKALKINADLSHWCVVCEHVFDATDKRDDFWPATLAAVAEHCEFVHMRIGYEEGPQVNEPDAPEHAAAAAAHWQWWRGIWTAQLGRAATKPDAVLWAEPEFGPPPYLHVLPYTQQPVADLWDINKRIAAKARIEFGKAASGDEQLPAASTIPAAPDRCDIADQTGFATAPAAPAHWRKDAEAVKARAGAPANPQGQGGGLLDLALKREKQEAKEAKEAEKAKAKLQKAIIKEGGKRGVEIEGASHLGGLDFFCTTIDLPAGDVSLLSMAMIAMNAAAEPGAEDRKGCSGHVGKMIFSAGVEQLALVAYVPAAKADKVDVAEWVQEVLTAVGGMVMMRPPEPADSPNGGLTIEAVIKADPENGRSATKDKDLAMAAAFAFLRAKGAFPEDNEIFPP